LALAISDSTESYSSSDISEVITGIFTAMSNVEMSLNNYLNQRDTYLTADFTSANELPAYYDTDPENFWTNTRKLSISLFLLF
jgi:hypothetical protein